MTLRNTNNMQFFAQLVLVEPSPTQSAALLAVLLVFAESAQQPAEVARTLLQSVPELTD